MYFSGLKKIIQNLEEKKFYDIAIMFLDAKGYKDISIIDGTGDGGRDVSCSRKDLRIQLSVRKDWTKKINEEAKKTFDAGKSHFMYVTNRLIKETEIASFIASDYKFKGDVDISVYDLNCIVTMLSLPGTIHKAYERLGMLINSKITATPKEVALSNILLFSNEAKDLRSNVIESNIKAHIFKSDISTVDQVVNDVAKSLPGADIEHNVRSLLHRLCSKGEILNADNKLRLSNEQNTVMQAAEEEYIRSIKNDVDILVSKYKLQEDDAQKLIELSLEIIAREGAIDGNGVKEIELLEFISNHKLNQKKQSLYEDLSKLSIPRVQQYGKTLDHIFSTDTFDIFRALGLNSNVVMLLDSSVAIPLICGLAFGSTQTRYGIAAAVLNDLCKKHNIKVKVPKCYLNEMATHGIKAMEFSAIYGALGDIEKNVLKSSGNAYISHFSNIRDNNPDLTLHTFLNYFGLSSSSTIPRIENNIESILNTFGIDILPVPRWEPPIREYVLEKKQNDPAVIIDHDAAVCTLLKNSDDVGYIFATWDRVIIGVVEGLTRVFADIPSRVTDFLSMAGGSQYENEQSYSLLTSLIYLDESKATKLAEKLEKIKSVEQAYRLKEYIDQVRMKENTDIGDVIDTFFSEENNLDVQVD